MEAFLSGLWELWLEQNARFSEDHYFPLWDKLSSFTFTKVHGYYRDISLAIVRRDWNEVSH